jgi:putative membrane protein
MMWGGHWSPMYGWSGLIFWLLLIVAIFFFIRWLFQQGSRQAGPRQEETALDVLKKRYARGEINKEEFEQKKKDLA